jgi:hypothetical protein
MATWGMTDGPARDPDRVTGNADRPRSRRATARRTEADTHPQPGHSLALIDRRLLRGGDRTTEYRVEDRWSPSSSHRSTTDSTEATPTPPPGVASSFPASRARRTRPCLTPPLGDYVIRRRPGAVACRWWRRGARPTVSPRIRDGCPRERGANGWAGAAPDGPSWWVDRSTEPASSRAARASPVRRVATRGRQPRPGVRPPRRRTARDPGRLTSPGGPSASRSPD